MTLRVGLTGGIGSGKTAVSDRLAGYGAVIIDSDLLAREVVGPGTPGLAEIAARFGPELVAADGSLDRAALARIVFADQRARRHLEAITHPRVRARAAELAAAAPRESVVVQVIPLLVETGQADAFDLVVVVDVDPEVQLDRVLARGGLDEAGARSRIAAQAGRADRLAVADVVIDNSGSPADLDARVAALWAELSVAQRDRAGATDVPERGVGD